MAVTPATRPWDEFFAVRTRGGVGEGIAEILALLAVPGLISFAGGFPDPRTFPRERAAALLAEFAEAGETNAFQYAPTRELVGKAFLDRGDLVVVEGPTYLGALMAFRGFGAELAVVPIDDEGLQVDELERRLVGGLRPKLLYSIPDHQNPAGVTLSADRREGLVELARRYGFLVFEDVAYRELRFGDESLPTLWSLGPDAVVQAGTTSKTFFPGVRLGWAAAPAPISAQLVSAKQNTDQCAGALGQRLYEEYVRRGWIDEQLAASRALYRSKCARMLAALERTMPGGARWTTPDGGFFSWLTLPEGGDAALLAKRSVEQGVGIVPGSLFFPDGRGADNVRLSFSLVDESAIDEGVARLAELV